jgi:hypothetical protein
MDSHNELATGDGQFALRNKQIDLRIVTVNSSMLHRVQSSFLNVVQIASATIRWEGIHCQGKATVPWGLAVHALALRHHLLAIRATATTNKRSPFEVSPVVIN